MPVTDGLFRHARHAPDRPALVFPHQTCSYGELAAVVAGTAAALRAAGARRVGLRMGTCPELLSMFLGAAAAGAAGVMLGTGWSRPEVDAALAAAAPDLLFTEPSQVRRWRERNRGRAAAPPTGDEEVFYIGFTSGSTGRPKGYLRSHRSWLRSFDAARDEFGIGEDDHVLAPGPLDHSLFLYAVADALHAGATVHLGTFEAGAVLRRLRSEPITRLYLVPTMVAALLRAGRGQRVDGLRSVLCSGAPWTPESQARAGELFGRADLFDFYGASELSFVSVRSSREDAPPDSVGRPFAGVQVQIRRPDGCPAPAGGVGRLWVRSEMLCSGYLHPDDTGLERDPDGWATVGDRARQDAAGHLYLAGREGSMIVTGGHNVYPEEVEQVLRGLPEVADAGVVGLPDPAWGELVTAAICPRGAQRLSHGRLREHCRTWLAREKWPRRYVELDALPRTSSGKLARARLRDGLRQGTLGARPLR